MTRPDGASTDSSTDAGSAPQRIRIEQHSFGGMLWLAGWLFTLGLLDLGFWKGVLALFVWPYYLGTNLTGILLG